MKKIANLNIAATLVEISGTEFETLCSNKDAEKLVFFLFAS